ncbi:MAG: PKD domain-containing protein [Lewinellaceae bacterium]|nr:PKD domain-containing protein [Lewinellaceae bacterium]
MKKVILSAVAALFIYCAQAQESISGIINAYTAVQSIDYCNNALQVSTTNGFAEGDALMLIQMQGAAINVSNTAAYGSVTDLGQAGLYERAVIAAINGLEITLEKALLNEYDTDGAVQVVSLPDYPSGALVTDILTARPWDGNIGGVLALEASTISLQAPIDVSGKGFRGGSAALDYTGDCNFIDNFNSFAYDETSIRGGRKGEGISAILPNRARGRGSQANGGGGGNDHNSGGGGGGNVTTGGQGGQNNNPSFFGCDGLNPGQGGKAINGVSTDRIFMGGGGGAGHGNNNVATDGGLGGGIIIIRAMDIVGNGFPIRANGLWASTSVGDGGGGGGGGGTIALVLENGDGNGLMLEAIGGLGGNANNNNASQCFGPGGGGSGGRILRSGAAMAAISLAGGPSGLSTNSSACSEGPNSAAAGSAGASQSFENLPESSEDFAPYQLLAQTGDTSSCAGLPLTLPVSVQGSGISFQWQVDEGNGFTGLQSGSEYGPTDVPNLLINVVNNAMDGNQYRLQITGDCIGTVFTVPLTLSVSPGPLAAFTFTANGLMASFDNTSTNADSYSWDFGDGNGSAVFEPTHTFPGPGTYNVTLSAGNSACGDTASFSTQIQIALAQPPQAAFQPTPASGCTPLSVLFSNTSTGDGNITYQWLFPGGDPATSTDGAPIVNYNNPGVFDVTLIAANSAGSDTLTITGAVQVGASPMAGFELAKNDLAITLSNLSSNADSYFWDFGDGNTSTATDPTHTYDSAGDYEVSLTVTNLCGSDVLVFPVSVARRPTPQYSTENPTSGCPGHTVYFVNESVGDYDSLRWDFPGGMPATSDIPNPEVMYGAAGQYTVQLTLFWLEGEEMLSQAQAIAIQDGPVAGFTFSLDGLAATFTNLSTLATSYAWDFGDGAGSNEENPVHAFSTPGTYEVTLLASNGACTDTTSLEITVQQVPEASFQPMPAVGCAPLSVLFNNTSTGGSGTTYQWFFPGGSPATSTEGSPIVNYSNPGVFDVTLIATNNAGTSTLILSEGIRVGGPPTADFGLANDNLTIVLTNLSTGADNFFWDFGDGNTSTAANPAHSYSSSGDYEVSLTVMNACGSDVMVLPVAIIRRPAPLYATENPSSGCVPYTVYFVNRSLGDYDSLRWDFPGGMPATTDIANPEVVYQAPGQYDVQLTLFWANGEEVLAEPQAITVLQRPQPAFAFQLDGLTASFTNLSSNATDFTWNFGDGTTSEEQNPVHTFPGPGNYNVTLNASNQGNCTRAIGQTVFIQPSGTEERPLPEGVRLFPNPTSGEMRLQSEQPDWYPVQWRLLNLQGQVLESGTAHQDRQWELGAWPTGAYLLQFFNEKGWWTASVVRY